MARRHTLAQLFRTTLRTEFHCTSIARTPGIACSAECMSSSSVPFSLSQQRGYANSTASAEHIKAKLDFQRSMKDLRRQWLEKGKIREKARAERQEAAFIRQDKFVERARQARELRQGIQLAKYTKQQQRILAQKAAVKEINAQWRSARDTIYSELQQSRRLQLIEQSRMWITADTLDDRIEHALDNPVSLSGGVPPEEEKKEE